MVAIGLSSEAMAELICPQCGCAFIRTSRARQAFCTPEHKVAFNDLMRARGRVIMPLLLARSMGRHTKGDQLGAYCRREADALIARWNQEDRACGRRPDIVAKTKQGLHWRAVDIL